MCSSSEAILRPRKVPTPTPSRSSAQGILKDFGVREVGIAGYPEGHPDIRTDTLWEHLTAKSTLLAEQGLEQVVLSQFAFDADKVSSWIRAVRDRGIDSPIRIGTPGPAGIKRLLGYAKRFGVGTSAGIVKKYGFSLTNLIGTAGPDRFVTDLEQKVSAANEGGSEDPFLHLRRTARHSRMGATIFGWKMTKGSPCNLS